MTAALPKLRPSLREAGVLPLSESVTSASSRELLTQVHTLSIMPNVSFFSSFVCHSAVWHSGELGLSKDIFFVQSCMRQSLRRKKVEPSPGRLEKQSPTPSGSWSLLLTSHLVSVPQNKTLRGLLHNINV